MGLSPPGFCSGLQERAARGVVAARGRRRNPTAGEPRPRRRPRLRVNGGPVGRSDSAPFQGRFVNHLLGWLGRCRHLPLSATRRRSVPLPLMLPLQLNVQQ